MSLLKCIKSLLSENPWAVNVFISPKNCWNLQKSTFILPFHNSDQNSLKMSFLVRSEILELLVNMLTTIAEYSCSNRENLVLPIPMELSKKLQISSQMFIAIWELKLNLKHFPKKTLKAQVFLKLLTLKYVLI